MFRCRTIILSFVSLATMLALTPVSEHFQQKDRPVQAVSATQDANPAQNSNIHYQIKPVNYMRTRKIKNVSPIWKKPPFNFKNQNGNTAKLIAQHGHYSNGLVQPLKMAQARGRMAYFDIARQGKNIGWIPANNLRPVKQYMLPYIYISQFWPSRAADACELASLKSALSAKDRAMNVPLHEMVEATPRSKDPNKGYTHNPYEYGSHATIMPNAMVKVARRYHARAYNITGASKHKLIYEVTHGNPVVFEGPFMMKKPGSDHDLTIVGYRKGYFYVADPFSRYHFSSRTTWVSTHKLMSLFNKPFRHQRAIEIVG